jgi:hypothetical protein
MEARVADAEEPIGNYRVALDVMDEDTEANVIIGDVVGNFEEFLNCCTDTWYRLQKIKSRRAKETT